MRNKLKAFMNRFRRDEDGVTLVEYGIALTIAVVVGATLLTALATDVNNALGQASTSLQNVKP